MIVQCTTGLFGGPTCQSSNGRTLTVGWRGWRTGQCPVAHRTVWCALRQQPSPTATLVVGAINTPNHHTSRHPSFQQTHSIQELVHSIQDTNRLNQNLSKSQFHSKQLVTRRESFAMFFWALALGSLFFSPFLVPKSFVIKARDTNCVVVLVGTKCPNWLRREAHSV
jgi:hypothetical protein